MRTKLIALTAFAALALGGAAFAQDTENNDAGGRRGGRGGGGRGHDPIERKMDALNLTAEQKTKVQPILDEAQPKMAEIHRDAMQKTKALMDETMTKIRPLLTPEQQTKLDAQKNDRRGNREGRKGRHGKGGGGLDDDNG